MKYDDASWHYGGDFPSGLPKAGGATHIGMFLAWLLCKGYASEELREDTEEEIAQLHNEQLTGAQFLLHVLDEKFTSQDLNAEGQAFTQAYYQGEDHDSKFVDDYFTAFGLDEHSMYGVVDSGEQLHQIAPMIDARYRGWEEAGRPEYLK